MKREFRDSTMPRGAGRGSQNAGSHAYGAEFVRQLTPGMGVMAANGESPIE
jgi:hypothetical protein